MRPENLQHEYDSNVQQIISWAVYGICARLAWGVAWLAMLAAPAQAVIVGKAPDSPESHVDPNVPESPWAGVGSVVVNGGAYSGVLIGPRHVLTAAHVVSGAKPDNVEFYLNIKSDNPLRIASAVIHVHPEYRGFTPGAIALDDLAVVELEHPVPAGIPIYKPALQALPVGTKLTFVGYGATGDGVKGVATGSSRHVKRVGANVIDGYIPYSPLPPKAYGFDFDSPDAAASVMRGGTLGNAVEATLASGDSGSPAFIYSEGNWLLAGINTFVASASQGPANAGTFGTLGGGMLVAAYAEWIAGILRHTP